MFNHISGRFLATHISGRGLFTTLKIACILTAAALLSIVENILDVKAQIIHHPLLCLRFVSMSVKITTVIETIYFHHTMCDGSIVYEQNTMKT